MSTRIVLIDYVAPQHDSAKGDCCTGCPRHDRKKGTCEHFGPLAARLLRKQTWHRHPHCIRAEERTGHSSISQLMLKGDFDGE